MWPETHISERWLRIVQISDLHFGSPWLEKVAHAAKETIAQTQADVLVVSGDITQRAKPEEFAAAAKWLASLSPAKKIIVPGNHDVPLYRFWERLASPYKNFQQHIQPELDAELQTQHAIFAGINTCNPYAALTNGRIRQHQLERVEKLFNNSPADDYRIIVAHHPFLPPPGFESTPAMPKSQRALNLFSRCRATLILGGHLHRAYTGNSLDVFAGEDRDHGMVIAQCGTTTSRRGRGGEREMNSLNVIDLYPRQIEIQHYLYAERNGEFRINSMHRFQRGDLDRPVQQG